MASRVSKRKRPSKDYEVLKQRWEIEDAVFDRFTLLTLSKFLKKGIIKSLDFPLNRGKEANVYRATTPKGDYLAVKIYRIETTRFFNKRQYILGDPRFKSVKKDRKNLAFSFAKKEFKNLKICEKLNLPTPKPIICKRNILIMTYLGDELGPYTKLFHLKPEKKYLDKVLEVIKILYKNDLVHADLSSYNLLQGPKNVYFIDFAQGVIKGHPYFEKFLERDVLNVLTYYKKQKDLKKTLNWIRS